MTTYNLNELRDKIHACWVGKNIGGTMGAPYEGTQEFLDVKGYVTKKGVILPNDDLDLQLIWLIAMEEYGPYQMTANVLAEYWLKFIPPEWNEYGVGKSNLRMGLLPPFSGEYENDYWKTSNGAWIRSEIWACLAPGYPEIALRYAQMDACVDHGMSEGTYAEWFTTALDSIAFRGGEIRAIIEEALTFIPEDCRVAKAVKLVMDSYDKKIPYRETRELLVQQSADLGWFQAPANVGYVILGLLYGEGDFKNSMIYTINCGDDTDCTAATLGAFFGILYGMKGIPEDWSEHIGDNIVTKAIDGSCWLAPNTCTAFTERIIDMIPVVMMANCLKPKMSETEATKIDYKEYWMVPGAEGDLTEDVESRYKWEMPQRLNLERSVYKPYSYFAADTVYAKFYVTYEEEPKIAPDKSVKASIVIHNYFWDPRNYQFRVLLPEGFEANYKRTAHTSHGSRGRELGTDKWDITVSLKEGANYEAMNKIIVEVTSPGKAMAAYVPIIILG